MMEPRMSEAGERRAVIEGRLKHDALLAWARRARCLLTLVAGR